MELARHINLFFVIVYLNAKRYAHYPFEFVSAMFNRFTSVAMVALFWIVVANNSDIAVDTTFLISYYLIVSGLVQIGFGHLGVASAVNKSIQYGRLNSMLVRPVGPFFMNYASHTGYMLHLYLASVILIVAGVVYGGSGMEPAIVIVTLINMLLINTALNWLVASLGFYFVEAAGVRNAIMHMMGIMQGFFIPLSLTPVAFQEFVKYTPFPSTLYVPANALLGNSVATQEIVIGAFWGVTLLICGKLFWARSLRKYEAIGI